MKNKNKIALCLSLTLLISACGEDEQQTNVAEEPKVEVAEKAAPAPKPVEAPAAPAKTSSSSDQDMTLSEAAENFQRDAGIVADKAKEAGNALSDLAKSATQSVTEQVATLSADAANGENVFKKCKACHTVEEGGRNKAGPNLFGIVGRNAGSVSGFNYSKDFASMNVTWSEVEIAKFSEDPTKYLREKSGNGSARSKMTFKLRKEQDRLDVAAYLATLK